MNRVLACRLGPLDLIRPHFFLHSMQCGEGEGDGCMDIDICMGVWGIDNGKTLSLLACMGGRSWANSHLLAHVVIFTVP